MKTKIIPGLCIATMMAAMLTGCSSSTSSSSTGQTETAVDTESTQDTSETTDTVAETQATEAAEDNLTAEEALAPLGFDVSDYVVLNDYKNMKIDGYEATTVTDEDVAEQLAYMMTIYPTYYEHGDKKTVEDSDVVNIDYTGYLNGETFDGGSDTDYNLPIGKNAVVEGFDTQLIGANVGETKEIQVTFPEDYGVEKLNGQEVTFKIKINAIEDAISISEETLCDKWVADNFEEQGYTSLEGLKDYLKLYLESTNESTNDSDLQTKLMDQLVAECEVTLPDGYLEKRTAIYDEAVQEKVKASGKSFKECMGTSEEDYKASLSDNMTSRLKKELILAALVKDMNTEVYSSVYDAYISTYMSNYNYKSADELYAALTGASELSGEDYVKLSCIERQALSELMNIVKAN